MIRVYGNHIIFPQQPVFLTPASAMQQFLEGDTKRPEVFVLLKVERDAQHVQLRRSLGWVLMAFQEFPWTQHDLSCAVDLLTWKLSLRWWQLDQELDPLEAGGKMERSHQDGGFLKWYPKWMV